MGRVGGNGKDKRTQNLEMAFEFFSTADPKKVGAERDPGRRL